MFSYTWPIIHSAHIEHDECYMGLDLRQPNGCMHGKVVGALITYADT